MQKLLILKILFLPLGVLISAFFSGSEIALTGLSGMSLSQLKGAYPFRKSSFEFWENHPEKVLASLILGNTLGTVFCGVLAAAIGKDCAAIWSLPSRWLIPFFSLIVTLLVFVFGEVLPKILGRLHSESLARFGILPLVQFTKLMDPIVQLMVRLVGIFIKSLAIETQKEIPTLTTADLKGMLESDSESSRSPSQRILKNILEFGQLKVKDVQKPSDKIFAIDLNKTPQQVIHAIAQSAYSRVLVYKESPDNIVGIIYAKDLLSAWRTEGLILIPDLLRPVYFISQEIPVSQLLREFRKGAHHLAIVRDAAEKVTGIVTIEDIIEEIVGEIYDESKMQ